MVMDVIGAEARRLIAASPDRSARRLAKVDEREADDPLALEDEAHARVVGVAGAGAEGGDAVETTLSPSTRPLTAVPAPAGRQTH